MAEVFGTVVAAAGVVALMGKLASFLAMQKEGLRVVAEKRNPEIDIVFVHGLLGHPRETWTSDSNSGHVNWPTDLLPEDIKNHKRVRILTYGYDSQLFPSTKPKRDGNSKDSSLPSDKILSGVPHAVYLHSKRLLEELSAIRRERHRDRAIIWVAHSLGGLIVQNALVQASTSIGSRSRHKAIELCTCGALYFGTPMREIQNQNWAHLLSSITDPSTKAIDGPDLASASLKSELLDLEIQRYKSIASGFRNYSFHEKRHLTVAMRCTFLQHTGGDWESIEIDADHGGMVKFTDRNDPNYKEVLRRIKECCKSSNLSKRSAEYFSKLEHLTMTKPEHEPCPEEIYNPEVISARIQSVALAPDQAESFHKKTLFDSEKENGPVHETTIACLEELGQLYAKMQQYQKAELLYQRAFMAAEDSHEGPCHPRIAVLLQHWAEYAIQQGKFAEATEILSRIHAIQKCNFGYSEPETLRTAANLAIVYDKRGLWQDAEKMYTMVINERETRVGKSNEATLRVMENLARNYRLRSKKTWTKAIILYKEIIQRRRSVLEFSHESNDFADSIPEIDQPGDEDDVQLDQRSRIASNVLKLAEVYEVMGARSPRQQLLHEWSSILKKRNSKSAANPSDSS